MKTWYIYKNDENIGQAKNIYSAIKHIESLVGHKAKGIVVTAGFIKYVNNDDVYTAKREDIR